MYIKVTFRSSSPFRREQWLAGSVLLLWAVLLVPTLAMSPDRAAKGAEPFQRVG
jgi:hypothetical protein